MVSEASDKIFEDFLKEDKKRPRESKKPKIDKTKIIGVENDLKAKLLAKQQAREKKSKEAARALMLLLHRELSIT